jgi:hypothetical protein
MVRRLHLPWGMFPLEVSTSVPRAWDTGRRLRRRFAFCRLFDELADHVDAEAETGSFRPKSRGWAHMHREQVAAFTAVVSSLTTLVC